MRISGINYDSIVDGEGLRDVVFLQGCEHHCEDCHNPQTWSMGRGVDYTPFKLASMLSDRTNNLTISGGEPLLQYWELLQFLTMLKNLRKELNVWLYTGFTFEEIPESRRIALSRYVDVLIDGRFNKDLKGNCLFRGSSNQRIIDLPQSVDQNKVILLEGYY